MNRFILILIGLGIALLGGSFLIIGFSGTLQDVSAPPSAPLPEETQQETVPQQEEPLISTESDGLVAEAVPIPFAIEADDSGFYPSSIIRVLRGAKFTLTIQVRSTNVYYGGLQIKSSKFDTGVLKPGETKAIELVAVESFDFSSYWPDTGVLKATGRVEVL